MWTGNDKNVRDIFVQSKLSLVKIKPDGSRTKTNVQLNKYKNLFYNGEQLNSLVFIQGESGSGKSTLLSKLVLDWCDAMSPQTGEHNATFTDVETLKTFKFLFHITLRDTKGKREVAAIIKSLIIDRIYSDDEQREYTYRLLHRIMEREKCIIMMDGLNEWTYQSNEVPLPKIATSHKQCVALITTRPWKMLDRGINDSQIDALLEVEGIKAPEELIKRLLTSFQIKNFKMHIDFMTYIEERKLSHFLTSPWWLTLLIRLWIDRMHLSNSVCEVNSILLDSLFKKANTGKKGFFNPPPFQCLSKTMYIEPHVNILDAISKAAFHFTCTTERSLVFSEPEIRKYLSEQDLKFFLDSGILTESYCSSTPSHSQLSFLHETIQEFLAAYYIAKYPKDAIAFITSNRKCKYFVLEMNQVIKYLCGLKCDVANQVISCLSNDDFLNEINNGISLYISTKRFIESQTLTDRYDGNLPQTKQYGEDLVLHRHYATYVLYQRMIIDCFTEAVFSGQKDLRLKCNDFIFNIFLDESDTNMFMAVLMENMSNVRSLVLDCASLTIEEILQILRMSKLCLERLQTTWSDDLCIELQGLNIRQLVLHGQINILSASKVLPSMSKLEYLDIVQSELTQELCFPSSLTTISLRYATCSAAFIHMMFVNLSSLNHSIECGFDNCTAISEEEHVFRHACDMSNVFFWFSGCSNEFYQILCETCLENLNLLTENACITDSTNNKQVKDTSVMGKLYRSP
ncbi:hypothetical protein DPMN_139719 [Dreissena polymorpha]|uniref:NACHT domain-containing protein n=1 Tax=Dreissena polymorpha TaxID=45954 RepID=A0A9D4JIC9_DREPO|nr:hypothetical protein DPMN_139719 [Dreissena polymorpha]